MGSLWNFRNVETGPTTQVRGIGHLVLTYLGDTRKVVLRVKLPPTTALRSTVSAESQVCCLKMLTEIGHTQEEANSLPLLLSSSFLQVILWTIGAKVLLLGRILV